MIGDIDVLREPLLAARLLREEILAMPVPPAAAAELRADLWRRNAGPPAVGAALHVAARLGAQPEFLDVTDAALRAIAAAAGATGLRSGPGETFHGRPAPEPPEVPALYDEVLGTVNAPRAVESWSPPIRAFVVHFLLRLVQPFDAPPVAVAHAAEALVLSSDGFDPRSVATPRPDRIGDPARGRPDPPSFVLARAHALVEGLGEGRDRLRHACARAHMEQWAGQRESGWNPRQIRFVGWLLDTGRAVRFRDYEAFHAGRGAPGRRTLQRDWRALATAGWIVAEPGGACVVSTAPLTWESLSRSR